MKVFTAIAAAATLVAQTLAYSTDICPAEELQKLLQLAAAPGLEECQNYTEFYFVPPSGYPTEDQIFLMCTLDPCHSTFDALAALEPADCVTSFAGISLNIRNVSDSFKPKCAEYGITW